MNQTDAFQRVRIRAATQEESTAYRQRSSLWVVLRAFWETLLCLWLYIRNSYMLMFHQTSMHVRAPLHASSIPGHSKGICPFHSFPMKSQLSIADPALAHKVISQVRNGDAKDGNFFNRGFIVNIIEEINGPNNLLTCPYAKNRQFNEFFHSYLFNFEMHLKPNVNLFAQATRELIAGWKKQGKPINLTKAMEMFALEAISKIFLELNTNTHALNDALEVFNRYSTKRAVLAPPIWWLLNKFTDADRKLRDAAAVIDRIVREILASSEVTTSSLLQRMHAEKNADGSPKFSFADIRDNLKLLFFAGRDTTSFTLTYLVYTLGLPENQRWVDQIRKELRDWDQQHCGSAPASYIEKVNECKTLQLVLSEALRVNPPAFVISRQTNHDIVMESNHELIFVPKHTALTVDLNVANRDIRRNGNKPDQFRPDRFADSNLNRGAELVFGAGPNQCIGREFAKYEIKTFLAVLCESGLHWSPTTRNVTQVLDMGTKIVATDSRSQDIIISVL